MAAGRIDTTCCITGGGPAGMMLATLLARAGVSVVVLEKHADFLRDFRGDTLHPSTLQVMHEIGLLESLLRVPHRKAHELAAVVGGARMVVADFRPLKVRCPYIAFMPQWDFLNVLAGEARRLPDFSLALRAEATGLLHEGDRVVGVRADTPEGAIEVYADLVVAADGRSSTLRAAAGLPVEALGAPMDVLWFRLSGAAGDPAESFAVFGAGEILVLIARGDHWQCGYLMPKGGFERLRAERLDRFRDRIGALAPFLAARTAELTDWAEVKLLTVAVDRLRTWWRPGLLCIGDAAHAMSPIGGVGINLAIQDAVAAANLLAEKLRSRRVTPDDLAAVQRRRAWPAQATQQLQVLAQNRIIARVLADGTPPRPPGVLRLLQRLPWLRRVPARLIGLGLRPEHVAPSLRGAA